MKVTPDGGAMTATSRFFNDVSYPVRNSETALDSGWQAPVTPWVTLSPDLQYVLNPTGGAESEQFV